jgi:hypothetical protein
MTGSEQARAALQELTEAQLRGALMALWVKDPTSFWVAVKAAS